MSVQAGTLDYGSGTGSSTNVFTIDAGATYRTTGASMTWASGSSLTNAGTLGTTNGTSTIAQASSLAGALQLSSGNLTITAPVTVSGAFTQTGGVLGGASTLTLNNASNTWSGGTWSNNTGTTTLATGASLTASGNTNLARNVQIDAGATFNLGGDHEIDSSLTLANAGTLILSGTRLSQIFNAGGPISLNNTGSILKTSSSTFTLNDTNLSNAGTLSIEDGVLTLSSGSMNQAGWINTAVTATFRRIEGFTNTGLISGSGTIDVGTGALTNQGTLRPEGASAGTAGRLTILGNTSLTNTSRIEIDIGGTLAGSEHDALAVTGGLALGGTLSAGMINGFPSASGQNFEIITAGSTPSGAFASSLLPLGFSASTTSLSYRLTSSGQVCLGVCWDGEAGDTSWTSGLNWSTNLAPTEADSVYISATGTINVNSAASAGSLTIAGSGLRLSVGSGGVLTVGGTLAGTTNLNSNSLGILSGGAANFGGVFSSTGLVDVQGGSLNFGSASTLGTLSQAGGQISGTGISVLNGLTQTAGLITANSFSATQPTGLMALDGMILTGAGGLTLSAQNGNIALNANGSLSSVGTLNVSAAGTTPGITGNISLDASGGPANITSSGDQTITAAGTLGLYAGGTLTGQSAHIQTTGTSASQAISANRVELIAGA